MTDDVTQNNFFWENNGFIILHLEQSLDKNFVVFMKQL